MGHFSWDIGILPLSNWDIGIFKAKEWSLRGHFLYKSALQDLGYWDLGPTKLGYGSPEIGIFGIYLDLA